MMTDTIPSAARAQSAATAARGALVIRAPGRCDYRDTWRRMQAFTAARSDADADELWLVEHPPVFTLGRNGKEEHVLDPGGIPVIRTDRGGQVTYHGPGQVVAYFLLNLRRRAMGVRGLVTLLEDCTIDVLAAAGIRGAGHPAAPGVYVEGRKIAALGLRIKAGCSYHGLSLNVAMDLSPFARINPCGYAGMTVTQLCDEGGHSDAARAADQLAQAFTARLPYARVTRDSGHG